MDRAEGPDPVGYRPLPLRTPRLHVEHRADGSWLLEQAYAMPPTWPSIPHLFAQRAGEFPDRAFVARRVPLEGGQWGDWQTISFGDALGAVRALAQALIDRGLGPDASVMVLSGPAIEHGLLMLAAQTARAPFVAVSSAFALTDGFDRLDHAIRICRPRLVFADDGVQFGRALAHLARDGIEIVTVMPVAGVKTTAYADLIATRPTAQVDASLAAITPDTHAKTIFTSGSTGKPKGVIQTQRMLTTIVAQHDAIFIRDEAQRDVAPCFLSWLPWSHVGGGNIMFADVINDAATLFIDEGRPAPGRFDETIRNLREIHPQEYNSVPLFFAHLAGAMEADPSLRDSFFSRLRMLSYGTAGLSQDVFDRLQALAVAATGRKIPVIAKYGSTETQGVTITTSPLEIAGPIGLPFPGITVKLTPVGEKFEIRARGATVTPGYLDDPVATAAAFDEEGFYRTGDAARFVDPSDPTRGLAFDGRITENFKLSSGTWVAVGNLRLALNAALAPLIEDCVIVGENRDFLGVLAWPRHGECARATGLAQGPALLRSERLRDLLRDRLRTHNEQAGGLSARVERLILLEEPPVGDEIADKGYVNQRATLSRRATAVEALYACNPADFVICA